MQNEQLIDIERKLLCLSDCETPQIFRKGLSIMTMQEWRAFLLERCYLKEDKRHFGFEGDLNSSDWWEISYQPEKASSYAYSNTMQPLHTDNAWFQDPAEINFFVMWKQAPKGGAQLILPLSRLLESMAHDAPALLSDLRSIPVVIKKGESSYSNNTTIITNEVKPKIYWNYYRTLRTSKEIDVMCEGFWRYLGTIVNSNLVEKLYCQSGDCFAFNDTLLLHGREAFEAELPRERVLYQSMWKL